MQPPFQNFTAKLFLSGSVLLALWFAWFVRLSSVQGAVHTLDPATLSNRLQLFHARVHCAGRGAPTGRGRLASAGCGGLFTRRHARPRADMLLRDNREVWMHCNSVLHASVENDTPCAAHKVTASSIQCGLQAPHCTFFGVAAPNSPHPPTRSPTPGCRYALHTAHFSAWLQLPCIHPPPPTLQSAAAVKQP
eukprot:105531-Chlamydomonas_euryale.AAC.2